MQVSPQLIVREDQTRLKIINGGQEANAEAIMEWLRKDGVALVKNLNSTDADCLMLKIAGGFGLADKLELQAGFAAHHGHRHNIGQYFMSVNKRSDYQFIPPHSEGNSFIGMQLAAFFCYENSTDGGETILMNIDDSSEMWLLLRESVRRGKMASGSLSSREIARARGLYRLNMPTDELQNDDRVLEEHSTEIPGLTLFRVLAKPRRFHSHILGRDSYALWDSIASIDSDSADQYVALLKASRLLKQPPEGLDVREMDNTSPRHVWRSGVDYSKVFKCKLILKLGAGDFIVQNNVTWTHSACNWSPGSGSRKIAASFA